MSLRFVAAVLLGTTALGASSLPAAAQGDPPPVRIEAPADPVEKAAFDMLDKHCARCHQEGRLGQKLKPAGRFGNVLMLGQMSVDANLVVPGNPDASLLFNIIAQEKMPFDVFQDFVTPTPAAPTADELQALRHWIEDLGKKATASCTQRKFMKNGDVVARIAADMQGQRDVRVKGMRYLTLSHLHNACVGDDLLEGYRQASVKLLNSLSSRTDVVKLETIDPERTILRFNIDDLGWSESDWNTVLAAYPYGSKPEGQLFSFLTSATGTALPYMRADWFTFATAQPPLYDVLLKLPTTAGELEKKLGIDVQQNIDKLQVQRAGFQRSGVSANNRMIERHTIASGYFWTSYDFSGNKDRQSLFTHPLGPKGESAFKHDGGESIFSLPNGFQGYYLSTADGKQLRQGPTAIVRDPSRRDLAVTNGISCFGCHDLGIRKVRDDVRAAVGRDKSFSKGDRELVEALYLPGEQMDAVLDGDTKRFRDAMLKAGIDPSIKPNGIEMINAFSKKYEDMLDLRGAAAEFGMTPEEFKEAAAGAGPRALNLARRIEQGLVPRDTFEAEFPTLVAAINDEAPIKAKAEIAPPKPASGQAAVAGGFDLTVVSDKLDYKQNENVVVTVVTKKTCNLTLNYVDQKGSEIRIFPNQFASENLINANQSVSFGGGPGFRFRLADKGTETVVAVCTVPKTAGPATASAEPAFTPLGNYAQRLTRSIVAGAATRADAVRAIVVEAGTSPTASELLKPSTGIPGAVSSTKPAEPNPTARAAIKVRVN